MRDDDSDETIRLTVNLLLAQGDELSSGLCDAIIAFGSRAVAPLLEIAERYELEINEVPQSGWGPVHAVALLGEWPSVELLAPLTAMLLNTPKLDLKRDRLLHVIPKIGAPVVEPFLDLHARAKSDDLRGACAVVLAHAGCRDERIYELLLARLAPPADITNADLLADYGDPRAIPIISSVLDSIEVSASGSPFENMSLRDCATAIQALGGTLTAAQSAKLEEAERRYERWRDGFVAGTEPLLRTGPPR